MHKIRPVLFLSHSAHSTSTDYTEITQSSHVINRASKVSKYFRLYSDIHTTICLFNRWFTNDANGHASLLVEQNDVSFENPS